MSFVFPNIPGLMNDQSGATPGLGLNQGMAGAGFQPQGLQFFNPSVGTGAGSPSYGSGLGMNIPTAQLGLQGIGALGNIWGAFQAQSLARKQFDFTKNMAERNLANQTQSYNTALTDRINSRTKMQGGTDEDAQAYLNQNRLAR